MESDGSVQQDAASQPPLFVGQGEMVERVNALDWSATRAGPVTSWPDSIRAAVSIALNSTFQLVVLAGRDLVYIYNDASTSIFGAKHPWALGKPTREVWGEIWPTIGPMLHSVFDTGQALRYDDLLLVLQRHGYDEEAYFTFSYSPIREINGEISGLFLSVLETTERYINERRMRTLSELAARVAAERSESAYSAIADTFDANRHDVPSAAMFLTGCDGQVARRVFIRGVMCEHCHYDDVALGKDNPHPVAQAFATGKMQVFDSSRLGPKPDPACAAAGMRCLALPLMLPGRRRPSGVLVLGVNPRKALDEAYMAFFKLAAGHVATAVANAEAARMEQDRLEALAELDQSKSVFLANASHELRTPLTLIEGPLGMLLEDQQEQFSPAAREALEMARRNTSRMKVLVDSLLDFARIEAGRMEAQLETVDLGDLTLELASLFRSGFAAAGIAFDVRAYPHAVQTMVDPAMWEKIVLNLLSNALKYTPSGQVGLVLERAHGQIELTVRDTGIGIAPEDLPHVTDRFYRGRQRGAAVRAEGTGLGLALVSELARLHGGALSVDSREGQGTVVTVRLPDRAPNHVAERRTPGLGALTQAAFASSALKQRDHGPISEPAAAPAGAEQFKVVVIDDNEDILRYIERLLRDVCTVICAASATAGLESIRTERPDLVLLDVMMPCVDGFELLGRIRAEPAIQSIPVIILSAHVGEHARLDAMAAGADDYLPKPFSGRELIATVRSHFKLARLRRSAIEREHLLLSEIAEMRDSMENLIEGTSDAFVHIGHDLRILAVNDVSARLAGRPKSELVGRLFQEVRPDATPTLVALREAMHQQRIVGMEYFHERSGHWFNVRCYPTPEGAIALGNDITARKREESNLRLAHDELEARVRERTSDLKEANEVLKALFDRAPAGIAMMYPNSQIVRSNRAFSLMIGYSEEELRGQTLEGITDPYDYRRGLYHLQRLLAGEITTFQMELRYRRKDGKSIWVDKFVGTIPGEDGQPRFLVKIVQDITDRKHAENMVRASQSELRALYERLQTVRKEERIALAREVHDHLGQLLSAAKIDIKLLLEDVQASAASPVSTDKMVPELRSALDSLDKAIGSVRSIARDLRPPEVENQGLYAAIRWHAQDFERRTRIRLELRLPQGDRGPSDAAACELFRIFQEALTNVLRHAMATEVSASVQERGGRLLLRVRDNGIGIGRPDSNGATLGLVGMRERAALAGGRVLVGRLRSGGTLVSALLPHAGRVHDR